MNLAKTQVARHVAHLLPREGTIGLGSGTTVNLVIEELAQLDHRIQFVSASSSTSFHLAKYNLREIGFMTAYRQGIDYCVDGADLVLPGKAWLLKGHGGALVREKLMWTAAQQILTCVDKTKISSSLSKAVPVEITPFALPLLLSYFTRQNVSYEIKTVDEGNMPFISDNGNYIMNLGVDPEMNLDEFHRDLKSMTGVVDTGIFGTEYMRKNKIYVGYDDHVELLT